MSRHTAKLKNNRIIAWGFDRPLQEYFLQEFHSKKEVENGAEEVVFSVGTAMGLTPHPEYPERGTEWDRGEILLLMQEKYKDYIPEEHRFNIALDLPI